MIFLDLTKSIESIALRFGSAATGLFRLAGRSNVNGGRDLGFQVVSHTRFD